MFNHFLLYVNSLNLKKSFLIKTKFSCFKMNILTASKNIKIPKVKFEVWGCFFL